MAACMICMCTNCQRYGMFHRHEELSLSETRTFIYKWPYSNTGPTSTRNSPWMDSWTTLVGIFRSASYMQDVRIICCFYITIENSNSGSEAIGTKHRTGVSVYYPLQSGREQVRFQACSEYRVIFYLLQVSAKCVLLIRKNGGIVSCGTSTGQALLPPFPDFNNELHVIIYIFLNGVREYRPVHHRYDPV